MAYNNYYSPYQNMYNPYQQYQPNYQQPIQNNIQPSFQQSQQQIQNGGFVSVHNENEARNYPIAPGNSVTFKDENAPYVYTKTQGFSQLDRPVFEKYRLVKEEDYQAQQVAQNSPVSSENAQQINNSDYAKKDEITALWSEIETLKSKLLEFEKNKKSEKVEVENDG